MTHAPHPDSDLLAEIRATPIFDDGGPAFPTQNTSEGYRGMSLRDWFAGQALAGCVAADDESPVGRIAADAYAFADAMIAERRKR